MAPSPGSDFARSVLPAGPPSRTVGIARTRPEERGDPIPLRGGRDEASAHGLHGARPGGRQPDRSRAAPRTSQICESVGPSCLASLRGSPAGSDPGRPGGSGAVPDRRPGFAVDADTGGPRTGARPPRISGDGTAWRRRSPAVVPRPPDCLRWPPGPAGCARARTPSAPRGGRPRAPGSARRP